MGGALLARDAQLFWGARWVPFASRILESLAKSGERPKIEEREDPKAAAYAVYVRTCGRTRDVEIGAYSLFAQWTDFCIIEAYSKGHLL